MAQRTSRPAADPRSLAGVDYVHAEASRTPLYDGGCTLDEIVAHLARFGLGLDEFFGAGEGGWGNAFFSRR